jgi:y4mF family transcriptional regulator
MIVYDPIRIGKLIRDERKRLKVTQRELAMVSGTGQRFIVDLEKGKPSCQFGKALKVLKALGLVVDIRPR